MMTVLREYTEGLVRFLSADLEYYCGGKQQATTDLPVFYNPRMQVNRDLSVIFLAAYMVTHRVDRVCEPLAGSGIRTLRYLTESPGDFKAIMFDNNPEAVRVARENIEMNGLQDRASVRRGDARVLLLTESRSLRFDFVDVDPFGSPAPFVNAAVQSILPREGLLALTATDMPALCGIFPEVAQRKYGGLSVRAPFSHEAAARLLIGLATSVAGMNDASIEPLASLSTDHYVRVWLHLRASKSTANVHARERGIIRYCQQCSSFDVQPLAEATTDSPLQHVPGCRGEVRAAGPLWIGSLYNTEFLEHAQTCDVNRDVLHKRSGKILELMRQEAAMTRWPYIDLHALCDIYGLSPPKMAHVMETLIEQGYKTVRTHFRPTAIRTTASVADVLTVLRSLRGGG